MLNLLALLAPICGLAGYFWMDIFARFEGVIVPALMGIMLSMGLTMRPKDFIEVRAVSGALLVGILLQFTVMPLSALCIGLLLDLSDELLTGMVLVGSVAGGTSSNVYTYLAKGNVALSVAMTTVSTVASIVATPLLLSFLVGSIVEVPAMQMLKSLLYIILLPILSGLVLRRLFESTIMKLEPLLPLVAVSIILFLIAHVVALNAPTLATLGLTTLFATLTHNLLGLLFGYCAATLLGFNRVIARTIAIEVGMQNSGLATALALKFFSPLTALPCVAFSIWLNITGPLFARFSTVSSRKVQGLPAVQTECE